MAAVSTGGGGTPRNDVRDAAIVDRLARGEADAVADLYDRHARMVYSLVLRILRDDANAEDVVQEVFVQAWQQAARYSVEHGTVPAWLLAIARRRALDRLRTPDARPDRASAGFDAAMPPRAAAGDLAAPLLASEDALMLRRALDALPFSQRSAIELAYFEGLSQREVEARLDEPPGTVKARLRAGLLTLRAALAPSPEGT